jgi:REP element-mobilizing transposase RayT
MAIRVLLATPIDSLGQLIQQALQTDGLYQVDLVDSGDQALQRAQTEPFDVALLDFDVASDFVDLVANLRGNCPEAAFIAIPPENDVQPPDVEATLVDAWLSLPFYLPDLLDVLDQVVDRNGDEDPDPSEPEQPSSEEKPRRDSSHPAPAWLQDVNRVAQHLTRLSLESAAPAALITRGSQLWAYAGQLPQLAADELARFVGRNWMRSDSDLAQFVRLETTDDEYMLYATTLGEDYVLALAFETETSFMEMRSQAGTLARQLSSLPQVEQDSLEEDSASEESPALDDGDVPELPSDWMPREWQPAEGSEGGAQDFLDELLSTIELPMPEAESAGETPAESQPTEVAVEEGQPQDEEPAPQSEASAPVETEAPVEGAPEQFAETRPTRVKEKRPAQKAVSIDQFALKSDSATLHNLTYACVLIPRLPQHHLVGRIAARLTEWMRQFSLAFGWRLEHISVRPTYLHWIAVVPPTASPGVMVDHIRRETSTRIFSEYPRLERENPSGEFWVSDYLVVNGRDAFSHDMVEEFIRHVRSRQGAL